MEYEWNDIKNKTNFQKHGIWFEEAQTIWSDERSLEFFDSENSENEDRFIRVGFSTSMRCLLVVFCERNHKAIRLISARKATKNERRQYEEGI